MSWGLRLLLRIMVSLGVKKVENYRSVILLSKSVILLCRVSNSTL